MTRGMVAGVLAALSLAAASPAAWAGTLYTVKGEATYDAMPDSAKIVVPLDAQSNGMTEIEWQRRVSSADLIALFKLSGARDVLLKEGFTRPYPAHPTINVSVSDFSMLPTLTRIATDGGYKGWHVFYDLKDRPRFARLAEDAALTDAKAQAISQARHLGLKSVKLVKVDEAQTCFSQLHGVPDDCVVEGEEPEDVVIVTAWKPDPTRMDFSVPTPRPEKLTGSVEAVFELQ